MYDAKGLYFKFSRVWQQNSQQAKPNTALASIFQPRPGVSEQERGHEAARRGATLPEFGDTWPPNESLFDRPWGASNLQKIKFSASKSSGALRLRRGATVALFLKFSPPMSKFTILCAAGDCYACGCQVTTKQNKTKRVQVEQSRTRSVNKRTPAWELECSNKE
jgi:hypothetical protein